VGSIKTQSEDLIGGPLPWVRKKPCALAVGVATALSVGPTLAQEAADTDESDEVIEEIVTTGIRQNLMNAQSLKRNADTIIESITAEDLGSFPDKSVAEALQRVAGITVNRFAASSDTAHFSAEPSGVIVRGLNQVRTEFNGRDSFSANSSRGLSWGDVSPELMSGVDTYKNQMAELIEGGIAGTVNMRTRLPFDQKDDSLAVSVNANYGDLSEEITPEASGLYSKRWTLASGGEFGVLANLAYSQVQTRSEGIQLYRMNRFRDVYGPDSLVYIPALVSTRDNLYDRERKGASLALQWADADDKYRFSTQYNRSEYDNAWEEYLIQTSPADLSFSQSVFFEVTGQDVNSYDNNATIPIPAPGTDPFVFDDRGLFQSGVMTTGTGWWGNADYNSDPAVVTEPASFAQNAAGQPMVNACYGWNGCSPTLRGIDTATTTRSNNNHNQTEDLSFNFKWAPNDRVRANFDLQYVKSEVQNYDIEASFWTYAIADLDLTGTRPTLALQAPINVNQSPGGFENPNNYYIRSIMDHVEDSDGDELAFRMDFEFDVDTGWLESVKVGARFADRDQDVRWTGYNWQNVANNWTSNQAGYYNLDRHSPDTVYGSGFTGYPQGYYQVRTFNTDFYGGNRISPNTYVFADMNLLQNQRAWAEAMGGPSLGLNNAWDPICSNTGDRAAEIPGTCFTPSELVDVSEETTALYLQFNFGGGDAELFGVPVAGNVGVRYVDTKNASSGGVAYPDPNSSLFYELVDDGMGGFNRVDLPPAYENLGCYPNEPEPGQPAPEVPFTIGCYISEDDVNFMNGADILSTTNVKHDHWLPSFNIKFELTDEWLLRFAASKALARPDMGNLKNYVGIGATLPSQSNSNDPLWIKDSSGTITGANVFYSGGAQNPFLAPVVATQYDMSLEYYFADVGSLTFALFQKNFDDYIQFGKYNREVTNNGVTRNVEVSGPLNGAGAEINGYEIAFQRFFDFLPSPFDGLGVQANYTYINNKGITNQNITNVGGSGTTITGQAPDQVEVNKLEGLSDDSYTIIGMYEKGPFSARVAYSWRSEYLVTAIDCCVAYPIWNEDYGQVDASLRWNVNDNWEISLQGSNLTNSETVLRQQVSDASDGGLVLPNAWFQNDRRLTFGVRFRN
jgi:iron complex outermembrane recepter protein